MRLRSKGCLGSGEGFNSAKKADGFRAPFLRKTRKRKQKIRPPKFELQDIEDYYTYYVLILEIPEHIFWYADYSFLLGVVENKTAYEGWLNSELDRLKERKQRG